MGSTGTPAETVDWRCERCGSNRPVGWRAGPAHEGFPLAAQCVPCGHVQDLPEAGAGWRSMDTAPRDGTEIEVRFRDGWKRTPPSATVAWSTEDGCWLEYDSDLDGFWRLGEGHLDGPARWRPLGGTP